MLATKCRYRCLFHYSKAQEDKPQVATICPASGSRYTLFSVGYFSHPSGHSSGSELQAHILRKLFPTRIDALLTRAQQVADGRVVAGVHYASDAEAGTALGDLLFTGLEKTNPSSKMISPRLSRRIRFP
jgi:membrane-associated phospholipid phosphatase